jgi:hypothetical protein
VKGKGFEPRFVSSAFPFFCHTGRSTPSLSFLRNNETETERRKTTLSIRDFFPRFCPESVEAGTCADITPSSPLSALRQGNRVRTVPQRSCGSAEMGAQGCREKRKTQITESRGRVKDTGKKLLRKKPKRETGNELEGEGKAVETKHHPSPSGNTELPSDERPKTISSIWPPVPKGATNQLL